MSKIYKLNYEVKLPRKLKKKVVNTINRQFDIIGKCESIYISNVNKTGFNIKINA
jgi:hypothetical protein